ncbi:MAG: hypothetical protein FJ224_01900 [Lentisphaerae bacterium]|nr:hypothetical protein [Lentisphaerota bacterium]
MTPDCGSEVRQAMPPGKWFSIVLAVTFGTAAAAAALNFAVDPLLHYRDGRHGRPPYLKGTLRSIRSIIPGLLSHRPCETVVVGTSMVRDIRPSQIEASSPGMAANVAVNGATIEEQASILSLALAAPTVRRIIWGVDVYSFSDNDTGLSRMPAHLYNNTPWDDYRYLLDPDAAVLSVKTLIGRAFGLWPEHFDWDNLAFSGGRYTYGREQVLAEWRRGTFHRSYRPETHSLDALKRNYRRFVRPLLNRSSDVHIAVFFPPYSILAWEDMRRKGWLEDVLAFKAFLISELISHPNISVFDFQADASVVCDFSNYKDLTHFSPAVSDSILAAVADGSSSIRTGTQAAEAVSRLRGLVESLDLASLLAEPGESPR